MDRSTILKSLPLCGLIILNGSLIPTTGHAAATLVLDTTTVGEKAPYWGYSGFYRVNSDYSLLTDGTNTFVNAPNWWGNILFRASNCDGAGECRNSVTDSSGYPSRMVLDADSNLKVGGQVIAQGGVVASGYTAVTASSSNGYAVFGTTTGQNAIYGESLASGGTGVYGIATNGVGTGVSGSSASGTGVSGNSTDGTGVSANGGYAGVYASSPGTALWGDTGGGVGVLGRSNVAAGVALRASHTAGGLAADFSGKVQFAVGPLTPQTTNTINIGSSALRFSNIYLINQPQVGSDIRLKKDIKNIPYGLADLLKLRAVSYRWKEGPDDSKQLGLIAQEVEKIIPDVVIHGTDPSDPLSMRYEALVPVLIKAVQEQQARIVALEQQRGRVTVMSIIPGLPGGFADAVLIFFLPLGLVAAYVARRRKNVGATDE